jgi:putative hydrolase of HD superfamily
MSQAIEFEAAGATFERTWDKTKIALALGKTALEFAEVKRIPRKANGERESDVEHSYMLALIVPELIESLELPLDKGLAVQYCNVHDLLEIKANDFNTFNIDEATYKQKQAIEHGFLEELLSELPPYTAQMLARYESQEDAEARFVKAVDKFLPFIVDLHGDGVRIMIEDNGVTNTEEYIVCCEKIQRTFEERFGDEFPQLAELHRELWMKFGEKFARLVPQTQDSSLAPVVSIASHTTS